MYVINGKELYNDAKALNLAKGANAEREKIIKKSVSDGNKAKGKNNNITQREEEILQSRSKILDSYKSVY